MGKRWKNDWTWRINKEKIQINSVYTLLILKIFKKSYFKKFFVNYFFLILNKKDFNAIRILLFKLKLWCFQKNDTLLEQNFLHPIFSSDYHFDFNYENTFYVSTLFFMYTLFFISNCLLLLILVLECDFRNKRPEFKWLVKGAY